MSDKNGDVLAGPLRVYAMAINQAEANYREAVAQASSERRAAIDEALRACELAMSADG
jgi:hypothetical protein